MVKVLKSSKARAFDAIIMTPATPKQANVKKTLHTRYSRKKRIGLRTGPAMFKNMPEPPGSLRHHAAGIARSIACSNACPYACMIRKTARLENGATAWGNSAFPPPGGLTKEPGRNLLASVKLSRLHGKKYPQRLSACPVNAISTVHIQRKN